MLSGYDQQPVGFYLGGEYYCPACAGERLGELPVARIMAGLASLRADGDDWDGWDPDGLVWRWEVAERLAEVEAIKGEGRRAHKAIDWDAVNGAEWGIWCDQCGEELAPPKPHKADATTTGMCRFCWGDVDDPIHQAAAP